MINLELMWNCNKKGSEVLIPTLIGYICFAQTYSCLQNELAVQLLRVLSRNSPISVFVGGRVHPLQFVGEALSPHKYTMKITQDIINRQQKILDAVGNHDFVLRIETHNTGTILHVHSGVNSGRHDHAEFRIAETHEVEAVITYIKTQIQRL